MADGMRFANRAFDGSGTAINAATVNLYDVGTVTPVRATTNTNATGDWEIDHATRGLFDIEIVNGTTTRRNVQDVEAQLKSLWLWNPDANEYAFGVTRTEDAAEVEVAYYEGDRATMADGDAAYISYRMSDDGGNQEEVVRVTFYQNDINPSADGRYRIQVAVAGTLTDGLDIATTAAGVLTVEIRDEVTVSAAATYPSTDDGNALGIKDTNDWSDLYLATGAVISWENDDVTLTHSANLLTLAGGNFNFGANLVFINDTSHAGMTTGLTINQGAADDFIFTLKSPDVATGITTGFGGTHETDDYFSIMKNNATLGGVRMSVLGEDAAFTPVWTLRSIGGTATTTKTTAAEGLFQIEVYEHDGANGIANITADGNVFAVVARVGGSNLARFVVDEDGDLFVVAVTDVAAGGPQNVANAAAFDAYDDVALIRAFEHSRQAQGIIRSEWDDFVRYREQDLIDIGVLGAPVADGGMWNLTQHTRLLNGAVWQIHVRQREDIAALKAEIAELRRALPAA